MSCETTRQEPYILFKEKGVVEDDKPSRISKMGASSSVYETRWSSGAYLEQEPWNPPLSTPPEEYAEVFTIYFYILSDTPLFATKCFVSPISLFLFYDHSGLRFLRKKL